MDKKEENLRSGLPGGRISFLKKALADDPQNSLIHHDLGLEWAAAGDLAAARKSFQEAARLDPLDADALSELGRLEIKAERLTPAAKALDRALERNPGHPGAWNNRGVVFFLREKYIQAEEAFSRAVALDEFLKEGWYNLADTREELGDDQGAAAARRRWEKCES